MPQQECDGAKDSLTFKDGSCRVFFMFIDLFAECFAHTYEENV